MGKPHTYIVTVPFKLVSEKHNSQAEEGDWLTSHYTMSSKSIHFDSDYACLPSHAVTHYSPQLHHNFYNSLTTTTRYKKKRNSKN